MTAAEVEARLVEVEQEWRACCERELANFREVKELRAEVERLKSLGKQFERDSRSFFAQSCLNLERAEKAEAEIERLKQDIAMGRDCEGLFCDRCYQQGRAEADAQVAVMRAALEHCRHRPHEHNPPAHFTITRCEVIDHALAYSTEAAKTPEKPETSSAGEEPEGAR